MNKSTLQKTGGCKAATTRKTPAAAAREDALKAALAHYLPALSVFPESENVDSLRKIVFANWLDRLARTKNFPPLLCIGR